MFSGAIGRLREHRARRLRRRISFLEDRLLLYREFPQNLGFEGIQRMAKDEQKLRRLRFAVGLLELRMRYCEPGAPIARASEVATD